AQRARPALRPRRRGAEDARGDRPEARPHARAGAPDRARVAPPPRRAARDAGRRRDVANELRAQVQLEAGRGHPELAQRARLELADPLARDAELPADLFERLRLLTVEPEAEGEHVAHPRVQAR